RVGTPARLRARQVEEPPDHDQVFPAGEELIDRGVLTGQADAGPDLVRLPHDVEPGYFDATGIRPEQGGQDADGGRLSGAVRTEDTEDRTRLSSQIQSGEGLGGAEALDDAAGEDCWRVCTHRRCLLSQIDPRGRA